MAQNIAVETLLNERQNMKEVKKTPTMFKVRNIAPSGEVLATHTLTHPDIDVNTINERIAILNKELDKPPSNLSIPLNVYKKVRQKEIAELEAKLR